MRKSVGIVTLYDLRPNYGNRLQNLAVQTILEKMRVNPVTYLFEQGIFGLKGTVKYILWKLFGFRLPNNIEYQDGEFARTIKFNKFNRKYIKTERIGSLDEVSPKDFYIVGSDQTWNSNWYKNNEFKKNMYMLTFAKPEKRISFSPSFGVGNVPEEMKPWFKNYLTQFRWLSVREDSGAKIIKELTGTDATVLVDPTMLLTQEEWRTFAKKPKGVKEGYILTYFLSSKCKEAKEKLNEIKNGRNVYELLVSDDKVTGAADPCEFLWLFDHADIILTDSFHACVFSFLFNKPFIVYDRNWNGGNMNSRLETLLKKFHLERKYANSRLKNDIWEHNYTEGYRQLELEREKAENFLKMALED